MSGSRVEAGASVRIMMLFVCPGPKPCHTEEEAGGRAPLGPQVPDGDQMESRPESFHAGQSGQKYQRYSPRRPPLADGGAIRSEAVEAARNSRSSSTAKHGVAHKWARGRL